MFGDLLIYIGPAGIPIRAKGLGTAGGIECVSELGLNALECEFVRRVGMSNEAAKEVGTLAKRLGIRLSVHCPYFVNLCSLETEKLEASKKRILDSMERAHHMGADIAVFHPGFYGKLTPKEAYMAVKSSCEDILKRAKAKGIKNVRLGLETMGKQSTFGTLEEIIGICEEVKGCTPVIDWAHLNCRYGGFLKTQADYAKIFEQLKPLKLEHLHTHVTCAEFTPAGPGKGNEKRHLTLDARAPDFGPLVKEILKEKVDITIISESPILEEDALKVKQMFERRGYKF